MTVGPLVFNGCIFVHGTRRMFAFWFGARLDVVYKRLVLTSVLLCNVLLLWSFKGLNCCLLSASRVYWKLIALWRTVTERIFTNSEWTVDCLNVSKSNADINALHCVLGCPASNGKLCVGGKFLVKNMTMAWLLSCRDFQRTVLHKACTQLWMNLRSCEIKFVQLKCWFF